MKTLLTDELLKKHGFELNEEGWQKYENYVARSQIESLINEVISQRAGEPVAKYEDCGDVFGFRKLQDIKHNSLLYLAADPSVIDYVKTLREALKAMIDSAAMEKCGLKIAEDAMEIPDSIKHLLT